MGSLAAIRYSHKVTTVQFTNFEGEFERIVRIAGEEVGERERTRALPRETVALLQKSGFGALRVRPEDGGVGIGLETLFNRLMDLAAADSNIAHLYRGHIAFVESLLLEPDSSEHDYWVERMLAGDFVGNAQSERQETAQITTRLTRSRDHVVLNGTKYYTTGSIYADWIYLSALDDDDERATVMVSTKEGVQSVDDWDGFGQPLTGSGTTTFTNAPVNPAHILTGSEDDRRSRYLTAMFQLCLLATVAGIAQAALDDAVEFVRKRRRIFGLAGETLPRDNELVQAVIGHVASSAHAARILVSTSAAELDRVLADHLAGTATDDDFVQAELGVFKAQQTILPLVLDATTELFEVGGASATSTSISLDRHWRNARTIASHNPAVLRRRALGDYYLNGVAPSWGGPPTTAGDRAKA